MTTKFHWLLLIALSLTSTLLAEDLDSSLKSARSLEEHGNIDGAIQILKPLRTSHPGDPQVEKLLAQQYVLKVDDPAELSEKRQYAQMAIDLAQKAADKLPADAEAQVAVAAAYGKMCDLVDSKTKVELSKRIYREATRALLLDPNSDFGHLILARWNFELASLNPFIKGFVQIVYGQFPPASKEEAVAQFKEAISLAPYRIVHHAEYAKALDAMGNKAEAREQWKQVAELKPIFTLDRRYQSVANEYLKTK